MQVHHGRRINTVGQQRVFVSDFCGENRVNFHFLLDMRNAIMLLSDLAKDKCAKGTQMATIKGYRGFDHLRLAWLAGLVAAVLVILSFLVLAGQMVPDYGGSLVDGLYDPIATMQATVPATSSESAAAGSNRAPTK